MTPRERQQRFRIAVSFLLVYFFWGSTYLAIRIAVEHLPAATLGAVRFVVAGALMLAYCALSGRKISLSWADAGKLLLIGVLLLTGGNVLLAYSEKYVPSGLAALIVAIVPLWVAVIEGFVLKNGDRLNARGWLGLALGVGGLVVLLWPQLSPLVVGTGGGRALDRPFLVATAAVLLGSLSWSVGSVISRRAKVGVGPFAATGWEMTLAGAVNFLITAALGDLHQAQWTWRGAAAIAYLVTFGSLVGFTAYIWLLDNVPTPKVATYAYVNPVIAVLLGWMLAGERVDRYIGIGAVVIVAAVALVTSAKLRQAPAPARQMLPACEAEA
jgi:drug/metabolite transporter (DMT)-like permease